jgi:hypothetical protein
MNDAIDVSAKTQVFAALSLTFCTVFVSRREFRHGTETNGDRQKIHKKIVGRANPFAASERLHHVTKGVFS